MTFCNCRMRRLSITGLRFRTNQSSQRQPVSYALSSLFRVPKTSFRANACYPQKRKGSGNLLRRVDHVLCRHLGVTYISNNTTRSSNPPSSGARQLQASDTSFRLAPAQRYIHHHEGYLRMAKGAGAYPSIAQCPADGTANVRHGPLHFGEIAYNPRQLKRVCLHPAEHRLITFKYPLKPTE